MPLGVILDGKGGIEELGNQQAEQHRKPCEVITWMAGALRPGINDTAMREAGAGLAPGLSVTAMDNAL